MPIDLYYMLGSMPCRAVLLTAKAVGVELNLKKTNILEGEQLKPEFLALNPQHCIPTMVDGDLVIWESKAICSYLASKYGKDDTLFPTDPRKRAVVHQLMYFEMGTLYFHFGQYAFPMLLHGEKLNPGKLEHLHKSLGWLDGFLAGHKFAAGDNITIADHALLPSVSTFRQIDIDLSKYSNIMSWLEHCSTDMPGYEMNEEGSVKWGNFYRSKLNQIKD